MRNLATPRAKKRRRAKKTEGRPTIGIRELKATASAIIEEVKDRRTSYAVTKRGEVEALIVPIDGDWGHILNCELMCAVNLPKRLKGKGIERTREENFAARTKRTNY